MMAKASCDRDQAKHEALDLVTMTLRRESTMPILPWLETHLVW